MCFEFLAMTYNFFGTFNTETTSFTCRNPTIELLKSSILVSISGIFRVYLAALLLQTEVSLLTCLAGGLIIYSVYTLDRALGSKEDNINRKELDGSKKEIGLAVSIVTFLMGSYGLAIEGLLSIAFLPLATGFLYSRGIKIGKFQLKLKGGCGVKNIVVGITWGIFIVGVAGAACKHVISIVLVFILYGIKVFVNSVIDDFKDVKGDALIGLKTLPLCLGENNTRNFLLGLHLLSHLILIIALIYGVLAFEPLIIACSLLCGFICILKYTNEEKYISGKEGLTILKDGESSLSVLLSMIYSAKFTIQTFDISLHLIKSVQYITNALVFF